MIFFINVCSYPCVTCCGRTEWAMVDQLGRAVALHTGQDEVVTTPHLIFRVSLTLDAGEPDPPPPQPRDQRNPVNS